jgi:hypothetical protein
LFEQKLLEVPSFITRRMPVPRWTSFPQKWHRFGVYMTRNHLLTRFGIEALENVHINIERAVGHNPPWVVNHPCGSGDVKPVASELKGGLTEYAAKTGVDLSFT